MDAPSASNVSAPANSSRLSRHRPEGHRPVAKKDRFLTKGSDITSETQLPPAASASMVSSMLSAENAGLDHASFMVAVAEVAHDATHAQEADDILEDDARFSDKSLKLVKSNSSNGADAGSDIISELDWEALIKEDEMLGSRKAFRDPDLDGELDAGSREHDLCFRELLREQGLDLLSDTDSEGDSEAALDTELDILREEMLQSIHLVSRELQPISIGRQAPLSRSNSELWSLRNFDSATSSVTTAAPSRSISANVDQQMLLRRIPVSPILLDRDGRGDSYLGGGESATPMSFDIFGEADPMAGSAALALRSRR